MNAKPSSATFFTTLPHALQLSTLMLLPLEDILAIGATSHDMRQLCAYDVAWRAIYEDLANRCGLGGMGYASAQKHRSLENHNKQMEEQVNYKHKTLIHVLAYFREEKQQAEQIIFGAMDAEREAYLGSDCRCSCHDDSDSDTESDCECYGADLDDFEYTYENWGEEEWAADEKIEKLEKHMEAIRKALEQHA